MNKSVEMGFDSTIITKALKIQFKIPDNYEFKRQIIKETKDIMSEKRELQLKKTHNAINPKELINNIK